MRVVVFVSSLMALVFIAGWPCVEAEPNDVQARPDEVVPAEPDKVEPPPAASFHDKCAEVLKNFVNAQGMVDYKTLRRKRLDLKALLDEFDNLDPNEYSSWPKADKIAFWISRFLRIFPGWGPKSILHIKGIWTDHKFLVMDEEFTLAEIEKRFFRKEFADSRIFFALNRASLSGPPLRNEPYYGEKLNKQLEDQVKRFLSSPHAFRIDKAKQRVYLSALFQKTEYGQEFISKYGIDKKFKDQQPATRAVLNFITNYVSGPVVSFLEVGNYSVQYIRYDWTINDRP
ncbi:MAG: DUF547 domain-containing protein [Planctomycetota bacterium]|jgi:hypothetical protein